MSWTEKPHPDWQPGMSQPSPHGDSMVSIDPEKETSSTLYPLVISSVVPRPIAFISTESQSGARNLSPYSYFNAVAHDPPILAVGHCWSKGRPKDSLRNILETGEFVVNLMSEWYVEAANHTCGPYPPEVDEMQLAGLTPLPSQKVKPPRVGESAVQMECKVCHTYDVKNRSGETTTTVVLGEVVMFHLAEGVTAKTPTGKTIVDPVKLRPMSRFGGNIYSVSAGPFFEIPRPDADGRYPGQAAFQASDRDKTLGNNTGPTGPQATPQP